MSISTYLLAEPTIRYCEANLTGWIAQPANAISSLFISLAGILILAKRRHPFTAWLGWVAIVTGLASFSYYVTFTFVGQLADLGSMFLLASFLIVAALRRQKLSNGIILSILLIGTGLPLFLTAFLQTVRGFNLGIPLFSLLLLIAISLELRTATKEKRSLKLYTSAFIILMAGLATWLLDYKLIWCDPATAHYINGHAVWHLFNALALLVLDRYYASPI